MTLTPEQIAELRRLYDAMCACTGGVGLRDGVFYNAPEIDAFERAAYRSFSALLSAAEEANTLRAENARMREALLYARPLVKKYGHTQGDNAAFHAELIAPIDRALERAP